ncbi:Clp protease N-terminal domain-containing protein [Streptomyces olivoreticuli]|uniref:Clp protease N-terminal domain-containing protein n=1 Tax=Streptomyces olivoreticuli TaxID=68246 RepID=UPI0013C33A09|nr:Clp protease N-terminal domain-containing protein [Streptomyces olivoreticuli]
MFERMTMHARMSVVRAQEVARELEHPWIGSEHLLLGLFREDSTPSALTRSGITADACRAALVAAVRGGEGLSAKDAANLREAGILLPADAAPEPRQRRSFFGRRKAEPQEDPAVVRARQMQQHLLFTLSGKKALENAGEMPVPQRDSRITPEHVLYGILDPEDEVIVRMLRHLGTDLETVRAEALADLAPYAA